MITHVLGDHLALCLFTENTLNSWPDGHTWVPLHSWRNADCGVCRRLAPSKARELHEYEASWPAMLNFANAFAQWMAKELYAKGVRLSSQGSAIFPDGGLSPVRFAIIAHLEEKVATELRKLQGPK